MKRVPEPEVMDDLEEVSDYQDMDHREVNQKFIEDFLNEFSHPQAESLNTEMKILDVGTGPGQIPRLLCDQRPHWQIIATDFSQPMLDLAANLSHQHNEHQQIEYRQADVRKLPFNDRQFDAIISNSLIHHLEDPLPGFSEMNRVLKPSGLIFIRDLLRPESEAIVEDLVNKHAGTQTPRQQQLLRQSLQAAFTLEEIEEMLAQCVHQHFRLEQSSDRHWTLALKA